MENKNTFINDSYESQKFNKTIYTLKHVWYISQLITEKQHIELRRLK